MKYFALVMMLAMSSLPLKAEEIITPAKPFTGWSWYNEPKKAPELKPAPAPKAQAVPDFSKLSRHGKIRRRSCAGSGSGQIAVRCSASLLPPRS